MVLRNPTSDSELARLYFDEGLSDREVGRIAGLTRTSVCRRLRQAGYGLRWARNTRCEKAKYRPTLRATTHDIAWAAGVYEGEGSCSLRRNMGGRRSPTVSVAQKESWLCYRLRDLFGGSVISYDREMTGGKAVATYYVWRLTNNVRTIGFLMTIYKFLSPRRQERIREAIQEEKAYANAKRAEVTVSVS